MKILSLYYSPCAKASLFVDNRVVASAGEERYSRIKNDIIFSTNAIKYCLQVAKIEMK